MSESFEPKPITVKKTSFYYEREPLVRPFAFKGSAMTEIWQTASLVRSDSSYGIGLTSQNALWSDGGLFASCPEQKANGFMKDLSVFALDVMSGETFSTPMEVLEGLFEDVLARGRKITGRADLRPTFALNALVGLDNALWTLFYRENDDCQTFDDLLPAPCRSAFSHHHDKVAAIPLFSYNIPAEEIKTAAEKKGYFFMKIKIGQPGTQAEMVEKDKARLSEIHALLGNVETPWTSDGRLPYYFDANGRYEKKESLLALLDHAEKIGALDRIALVEEPFDETAEIDVSDIPVRLAADESAHTVADVRARIEMGYRAIALKPAAKTLSMSFLMAAEAKKLDIPCFVADLTVNPVLVDWNKNVAARLDPFPGLDMGLLESNGHQNYRKWPNLLETLPNPKASWVTPKNGIWTTGKDFYVRSGNIFDDPNHYPEELL